MKYWLMKTEPSTFSIQDLAKAPGRTTHWDGVRNYQARNFMRDDMKVGDRVLVYHSNAEPSAVVGTATIAREAYADATAFDPKDVHYDSKSDPSAPTWVMVDVRLEEIFPSPLPLGSLKEVPALKDMELLRKGSRLSIQPVRKAEFDAILRLAAAQGTGAR